MNVVFFPQSTSLYAPMTSSQSHASAPLGQIESPPAEPLEAMGPAAPRRHRRATYRGGWQSANCTQDATNLRGLLVACPTQRTVWTLQVVWTGPCIPHVACLYISWSTALSLRRWDPRVPAVQDLFKRDARMGWEEQDAPAGRSTSHSSSSALRLSSASGCW